MITATVYLVASLYCSVGWMKTCHLHAEIPFYDRQSCLTAMESVKKTITPNRKDDTVECRTTEITK